jgi:hypothetical protein
MGVPTFLYHYTSIESLGCILKNGTFRFTRLDNLNDPLEGLSLDIKKAREHIFVSSWTSNPDDQIPMWKMYTGDMTGVRIGLPSNLFSKSGKLEIFELGIEVSDIGCRCDPLLIGCSIYEVQCNIEYIFGPRELVYKDTKQEVTNICGGYHIAPTGIIVGKISLNNLGNAKINHWQFEQEWRFRVYATLNGFPGMGSNDIPLNRLLPGVSIKYIDVPFNKRCLEDLEILIGPKCNEGHEIIVEALIREFAPKTKVIKSNIQIV